MRTRAALGSVFASITVLIVGWQAGASAAAHTQLASAGSPTTPATTPTTPATTPSASPSPPPAAPTSSSAPPPAASAPAPSTRVTVKGSSVDTPFGSVQVEIVVQNKKITDVVPLHLTDAGGRSVAISNQAAPILRSEVLAAQSANVDMVGGATFTSEGYLTSLQAAIDKAGL